MTTIGNSLSGLVSASTRIKTASENIAKAFVEGRVPNEGEQTDAYTPKYVVDTAQPVGGVLAQVYERTGAYRTTYNPQSPKANTDGNTLMPDVNIDEEIVNAKLASVQYKANASLIKAELENEKEILDILA